MFPRAAPLMAAYPKSHFVEARLSKETVLLTRGANVVCLFVNDDWCGDALAAARAAVDGSPHN